MFELKRKPANQAAHGVIVPLKIYTFLFLLLFGHMYMYVPVKALWIPL